jgi:hypothetical protein
LVDASPAIMRPTASWQPFFFGPAARMVDTMRFCNTRTLAAILLAKAPICSGLRAL